MHVHIWPSAPQVRGGMHVVVDLATDPAGAFPSHKDASSRAAAADALAYRLVDALLSDTSELYRGRIGATVDPTQGDNRPTP